MHTDHIEFGPYLVSSSLEPLVARLKRQREALTGELEADPNDHQARRELGRVDVALRWAAAGHYGTCTVCSDPLPHAQLHANPADTVCRDCQEAAARSRRQRRRQVDPRPLSLIDGPEALTRGFARARSIAHE